MTPTTIKIKDQSLTLKSSFRALMEYETLTGRNSFDMSTNVGDSITAFYCMLKAANRPLFNMTLDAFIDLVDDEPTLLEKFYAFLLTGVEKAVADKKKVEKRTK